MLLTFRIRNVLSVLRIVDSVGSGFDLVRIDTLLDEEISNLVSSSLSQVAVMLFCTQIAGITFNDKLKSSILLENSNSLINIVVVITDLRNILVKVEEDLGL